MSFCPGITLKQYLADNLDSMADDEKARMSMLREILKPILSLWTQGYCHRDLHGENILIDTAKENFVSVIDFGEAAILRTSEGLCPDAAETFQSECYDIMNLIVSFQLEQYSGWKDLH